MTVNAVTTNSTSRILNPTGVQEFFISTEDDLPPLVGGRHLLSAGHYHFIQPSMLLFSGLEIEAGADVVISGYIFNQLLYFGTDPLFSGTGAGNIVIERITGVLLTANSSAYDFTDCGVVLSRLVIMAAAAFPTTFGIFSGTDLPNFSTAQLIGFFDGLTVEKAGSIIIDTVEITLTGLSTNSAVTVGEQVRDGRVTQMSAFLGASEFAFKVSPDRQVQLDIESVGLGSPPSGLFNDTSGSTGTFTAVANDAVASTSITSVTDSSGTARFNFTVGPTLFVSQQIVLTGYVSIFQYNGTFIVSATGAGFFELTRVDFLGNEASGSFSGDRVTFTDIATTLVDGDAVTLNTDGSVDYDIGGLVFNQLTNSFQMSAPTNGTATGTWSTEGLDFASPFFLVRDSTLQNSSNIGSVIAVDNTTVIEVDTRFEWLDFDFDGAAVEGTNIELWKLLDTTTGELIYKGSTPFKGSIDVVFIVLMPGNQNYEVRTLKNDAVLPDAFVIQIATDSATGTFPFNSPITAVKGDRFRMQVRNIDGEDDITTVGISLTIQ